MHSKYKTPGYLERAAALETDLPDYHKPKAKSDPNRDVKPAPKFTAAYAQFHRVWAEILRDALAHLADDLSVPAEPRGLAKAVLEGYEAGREKWAPDALLNAVRE